MKKISMILAALFAAFFMVSCDKNEDLETVNNAKELKININVADLAAMTTKAAKTAWTAGDRINILFDSNWQQSAPDIVIEYNGTSWEMAEMTAITNYPSTEGKLYAAYASDNHLDSWWLWDYHWGDEGYDYTTIEAPTSAVGGVYPCTPLMAISTEIPYTYTEGGTDGVLTATINNWEILTPFKVLIKGLNNDAENYALEVSNEAVEIQAFYPLVGLIRNASELEKWSGEEFGELLAGGVKESDGIAFYFNTTNFNINNGDAIKFTLKELNAESNITTKTYTVTASKDVTFGNYCYGIALDASKFEE